VEELRAKMQKKIGDKQDLLPKRTVGKKKKKRKPMSGVLLRCTEKKVWKRGKKNQKKF